MDINDPLPGIQCVWHGADDAVNLRQFLASSVAWAELDVNLDPEELRLILRHDTCAESRVQAEHSYSILGMRCRECWTAVSPSNSI